MNRLARSTVSRAAGAGNTVFVFPRVPRLVKERIIAARDLLGRTEPEPVVALDRALQAGLDLARRRSDWFEVYELREGVASAEPRLRLELTRPLQAEIDRLADRYTTTQASVLTAAAVWAEHTHGNVFAILADRLGSLAPARR